MSPQEDRTVKAGSDEHLELMDDPRWVAVQWCLGWVTFRPWKNALERRKKSVDSGEPNR